MTVPSAAWHADDELLRSWVDGRSDELVSASVEQHLMGCETCRLAVAAIAVVPRADQVWEGVLTRIDGPAATRGRRLLERLGLGASDALVVSGAPSLRASWLCATVTVLAFAVAAANWAGGAGLAVFLMAAPLLPVAGVAGSYGPGVDPTYEITMASPYPDHRLVLLRTAAVLATTVPTVVATGLVLPVSWSVAVAWMLPAAVFLVVVLAAGTWVDPTRAAAALAGCWSVAVLVAARLGDPVAVLQPGALAAYAGLALAGGWVLVTRLRRPGQAWPSR